MCLPVYGAGVRLAGADKNAASAAAVRICSLTINFGRTNVLRNLDLQLASGDARIILGPNGAGKSTLFNAVSGLVKTQSGSIELGAEPVTGTSPHVIAR